MKLPSVYANKIEKKIDNNIDYYRGDGKIEEEKKDIKELKKYFDKNGYVNRLNVLIKTNNGSSLEKLILCKEDYFINIYNKRIYFKDIIDYEIKK